MQGTITTPRGFLAGGIYAGIKKVNSLDLGIFYSEAPCAAAGVFTRNRIKSAPVVICQRNLENGSARALVVNSGCANSCTGQQGLADADEMATKTAAMLGLPADEVLVCSTGVIGVNLPMDLIRNGIEKISLSGKNGCDLAKAIMTTDTSPKETAVLSESGRNGTEIYIGGIAKGSGMIHPDLATMLCFLSTDAFVEPDFLKQALQRAVDISFNMITIDGDNSPNDSVILFANGLAKNRLIKADTTEAEEFENALQKVCLFLARAIARDGEGATRLIEITVDGAVTVTEARTGARVVAGSTLVKAAVHGSDPNWGRIIAAIGRSGVELVENRIDLYLNQLCLMKAGCPQRFEQQQAKSILDRDEVSIRICLNLGESSATAWGCDLSEEYVTINSEYTT